MIEEADRGKRRQVLVPICMEAVRPPLGFGQIQAADLSAWQPDSHSDEFDAFLEDLVGVLGPTVRRDVGVASKSAAAVDERTESVAGRECGPNEQSSIPPDVMPKSRVPEPPTAPEEPALASNTSEPGAGLGRTARSGQSAAASKSSFLGADIPPPPLSPSKNGLRRNLIIASVVMAGGTLAVSLYTQQSRGRPSLGRPPRQVLQPSGR